MEPDLTKHLPVLLTVTILSLILIEWGLLVISKNPTRNKEAVVNIISAGFAFFPIFILQNLIILGFMFWLYQFRIFSFESNALTFIAAWVVYDFNFWLIHFLGHRVRVLWCIHAVHHQPHEMKLSVGFRGSFLDFLITPHNIIWMPLIGFDPVLVLAVDVIGKMYGVLVHVNENWITTKRWKWIEWIVISPSLHRAHHSTNHIYLDRNYGETLSVWDRIFGTIQPYKEKDELKYGVMKNVNSESLLDSQLSELRDLWSDIRSTDSIADKMKYLFFPPGWNHLDGGILADDLRAAAEETARAMALTDEETKTN